MQQLCRNILRESCSAGIYSVKQGVRGFCEACLLQACHPALSLCSCTIQVGNDKVMIVGGGTIIDGTPRLLDDCQALDLRSLRW